MNRIRALIFFTVIALCALGIEQSAPRRGTASWYYPFHNRKLVAACRFYPIGSKVKVAHGSKSVVVEIIERGPAWKLVHEGRIIDLSPDAFSALENTNVGIIKITIYDTKK